MYRTYNLLGSSTDIKCKLNCSFYCGTLLKLMISNQNIYMFPGWQWINNLFMMLVSHLSVPHYQKPSVLSLIWPPLNILGAELRRFYSLRLQCIQRQSSGKGLHVTFYKTNWREKLNLSSLLRGLSNVYNKGNPKF